MSPVAALRSAERVTLADLSLITPAPGVDLPKEPPPAPCRWEYVDLPVITEPEALDRLEAFLSPEVITVPCWHCGEMEHHPHACPDAPSESDEDPDFEGRN